MTRHVRYIGTTDEQVKYRCHDDPRGLLTIGQVYILDYAVEHDWHTDYYLLEFPGKKFNSVSFEKE